MQIESISQAQINLLVVHGDGRSRMWVIPDVNKDSPEEFTRYYHTCQNISYLMHLGLLTDASDEEDMAEMLKGIKEQLGREAYGVTITVHGMAMFGEITRESRLIH